jgi:16S rRNA processing protein RimM
MGQATNSLEPIVVVGRLGAKHGLQGWMNIQSFTQPPEKLFSFKTLYLQFPKEKRQICKLEAFKPQGNKWLVKLQDCNTPEQAAKFCNLELGVLRSELPTLPEEEYYWADLIGLEVVTEMGESLGVVDRLFETGANDILVVTGADKEHFLPFIEDYILKVDLSQSKITVAWDPEF